MANINSVYEERWKLIKKAEQEKFIDSFEAMRLRACIYYGVYPYENNQLHHSQPWMKAYTCARAAARTEYQYEGRIS